MKRPFQLKKILVPIIFLLEIICLWSLLTFLKIPAYLNLHVNRVFQNASYTQFGPPPSLNQLRLLRIDDISYQAIGLKWPWPRSLMATALEKIHELKPQVILLDYTMMGRSSFGEEDDQNFAGVPQKCGNVILASYFTAQGPEVKPLESFSSNSAGTGFINVPLELDDRVHAYWMFLADTAGRVLSVSLPLRTVLFVEGLSLQDVQFSWEKRFFQIGNFARGWVREDLTVPIYFRARPKDFKRFSFIDLFREELPKKDFENRWVLIGSDGVSSQEILKTPLGSMSGLYILANSLLNFLDGMFIYELRDLWNILIVMAWGLIWTLIFMRFSTTWGFLILMVSSLFYFFAGYIAFLNRLSWDMTTPWLVESIQFLGIQIYRVIAYFRLGARVKQFAVTDWLTHMYTYRYFRFLLQRSLQDLLRERKNFTLGLFQSQEESEGSLQQLANLVKSIFPRKTLWSRYSAHRLVGLIPRFSAHGVAEKIQVLLKGGSGNRMFGGLVGLKECRIERATDFLKAAEVALEKAVSSHQDIYIFQSSVDSIPKTHVEEFRAADLKTDVAYLGLDIEMRERELNELRKSLEKAYRDRLRSEKLAATGEMVAKFYHEVNNPVANIQMCLDILKNDDAAGTGRKEIFDTLVSEVHRLARLTKQMVVFFRPSDEKKVPSSINSILEEILNLSSPKLTSRSIRLEKKLQVDLPLLICSPDQMKQVALNVVINAIDAMPKGGILTVGTVLKRIGSQSFIEILFKDTGLGIPEEIQDKIFDAFFTTKGEKGTGLGLSTCYNIVKAHQGTIDLESRVGQGTEFVIRLPVRG